MRNLTLKERIFFGLICNEKRVYHHWYSRFLLARVDIDRIQRVVARTRNWFHWLDEWSEEGKALDYKAENALHQGDLLTARNLFHAAAGCYHVGQHFFYDLKKDMAMSEIWRLYDRAVSLYNPNERKHADLFMNWATGEKELVYYPDGEHVCANYLDEVIPKTIDWLLQQFHMKHGKLNYGQGKRTGSLTLEEQTT